MLENKSEAATAMKCWLVLHTFRSIRFPVIERKIHRRLSAREVTAYHEAGHLVVGDSIGLTGQWATIEPQPELGRDGYRGVDALPIYEYVPSKRLVLARAAGEISEEKFSAAIDDELATLYKERAIDALAGAIAEKMATGRLSHKNALDDYLGCYELCEKYLVCSEVEILPLLRLLLSHTRDILALHWDRVSRVAEALIQQKTLSVESVHRILSPRRPQ